MSLSHRTRWLGEELVPATAAPNGAEQRAGSVALRFGEQRQGRISSGLHGGAITAGDGERDRTGEPIGDSVEEQGDPLAGVGAVRLDLGPNVVEPARLRIA